MQDQPQDKIDESEARRIASEWHGGQWSALYAFASSGHLDSLTEVEAERCVREARHRADDPTDASRLASDDPERLLAETECLLAYVIEHAPEERFCRECGEAITLAADGAWEDWRGACGCGSGEHEPEA